jgi:hypothetical protein
MNDEVVHGSLGLFSLIPDLRGHCFKVWLSDAREGLSVFWNMIRPLRAQENDASYDEEDRGDEWHTYV